MFEWSRDLRIVAEAGGGYAAAVDRHATLEAALGAVTDVALDELSEDELRTELAVLERVMRRAAARQGEAAGALADRQVRRAHDANPRDGRAAQRARRQVAQDLAGQLQWDPGRAKRTIDTQRQLQSLPTAKDAARTGKLTGEHAQILARTLKHLAGEPCRQLEEELVPLAATMSPVEYGRACRRRLAQVDPDAADRDAARLHARRAARLASQPDGTSTLWASLSGLGAETVATALDVYRTHTPGDMRTPEQRTADALVAVARAALDHHDTTDHGVRPHVTVTISWAELCASAGAGETPWTGPIPASEVRRLLDDSTITRLITGPDSLPLDVGRAARSVPVGTWKAIVARDGHCTVASCDAPPSMCQAVHLDRRWNGGAGTSVDEQALACETHHIIIDRQGWIGRLVNGRVVWDRPTTTPPGDPPDTS